MGDFVEDWKRHRDEVEDQIDHLPQDLRDQIRWVNLEGLFLDLEAEFVAGDVSAVLKCVHLCVVDERPPQAWPEWARDYFVDKCEEGYEGKLKSWDQVFGHPYTEDAHRRNIRDAHFPWVIYKRIEAAKEAGRPIDDKLFEEVGLELGVGGKTLTKNLYARARDAVAEVKEGIKIHEARMEVVYRTVEALSAQGEPLDKIFGELANFLHTDEADVIRLHKQALEVHGAAPGPTPQNRAE
jgi:hypothetical protein